MEWRLVYDPWMRQYTPGFDRDKLYQFKHGENGEVRSFRLSQTSPYFNIANLYYRDPLKRFAQNNPTNRTDKGEVR